MKERRRITLSRRKFIKASALLASGNFLIPPIDGTRISVEEEVGISERALGVIHEQGALFSEGGNLFSVVPQVTVEVLGYGEGFTYKARYLNSNVTYEIPIEQVEIIQGDPILEREIKPHPFVGIRNDNPELMHIVSKMGASMVRIDGAGYDLSSRDGQDVPLIERTRQAIKAAKQHNLDILYVYHPTALLPQNQIRQHLTSLFDVVGSYDNFILELGNEPNDSKFWENGDLSTFSDFVDLASQETWRIHPRAQLVLGALSFSPRTEELLGRLQEKGVNLSRFQAIAAHVYHDVVELRAGIQGIENSLRQRGVVLPIMITELGTQGNGKSTKIIPMIEEAQKQGVLKALIHELPNYEGWGYIDEKPNTDFYMIQWFTQNYELQ